MGRIDDPVDGHDDASFRRDWFSLVADRPYDAENRRRQWLRRPTAKEIGLCESGFPRK